MQGLRSVTARELRTMIELQAHRTHEDLKRLKLIK